MTANTEKTETTEPTEPRWVTTHLWSIAAVRDVTWFAFGALLFLMAFWLRDVLTPFLIAFAVAYVVKPVVDFAEDRWAMPRIVASAGLVLLTLAMLFAGIMYFAPLIFEQTRELVTKLPDNALHLLEEYGVSSYEASHGLTDMLTKARENPGSLVGVVTSAGANAVGYVGRFVGAATYLATAAVIVPMYCFYFLWRYEAFLEHVRDLIPAGQRTRTWDLLAEFDDTFGRWVRGRIGVGLIQVVLFCVGFWLVDIPFWFLLGVFTGLLCIVPIVGFLGWPLAILAKAIEGGDMMDVVVWPSVVYGIVQCIETFVLSPIVEGTSLNISPFMVLFAIIVGGAIGGFFGILLAVPLANCIAIVYTKEIKPRLDEWSRGSDGIAEV
jgi:predicted PurR-regulated permease PerM